MASDPATIVAEACDGDLGDLSHGTVNKPASIQTITRHAKGRYTTCLNADVDHAGPIESP
jgi:hypothetical protein